jgi:hypothetical protein
MYLVNSELLKSLKLIIDHLTVRDFFLIRGSLDKTTIDVKPFKVRTVQILH